MESRIPNFRRLLPERPTVACAQCGRRIYTADWSEYLDDRHVRHLWACETCDYRYETLVIFPPAERPAA